MNPKTKNIVSLVLCVLLTFAMLGAGITKLMGQEMHVQNFARWGYPPFFLYLVGGSQVLFAILLWIKGYRTWAALGIVLIFIGAIGTHIIAGELNQLGAPIVLLLMGAGVYALNKA